MSRRAFCAERSRENAEPLAATASRVDRWILVEYRGLWGRDAVESSGRCDFRQVFGGAEDDEDVAFAHGVLDLVPDMKLLFASEAEDVDTDVVVNEL